MKTGRHKSPSSIMIYSQHVPWHSHHIVYPTENIPLAKKKTKQVEMDLDAFSEAAECLKILAHPHRLMIVQMLLSGKKYTVGELCERCEITQPQTSDHLRLMQRCGFLKSERDGRSVYYEVCEPHLQDVIKCIENRFGKTG